MSARRSVTASAKTKAAAATEARYWDLVDAPPGTSVKRVALWVDAKGVLVGVKINPNVKELPAGARAPRRAAKARRQLAQYLAGKRKVFDLAWRLPSGITPFSRHILNTVAQIPFGLRVSYGDVADRAGHPGAARAVGSVMAKNELPLVIPCHRVVAAGGLGGFTGGLDLKRSLLALESADR